MQFDILEGVYETHIQVRDLEAAMEFYGKTLGLDLGYVDERRIAFYFVPGTDGERSMVGLWKTEEVSPRHFALRVTEDHVDDMTAFLIDRDIEIVEKFDIAPEDQPLVHAWMPAAAIFFEDPDGNLLELIADLSDKPRPDLGSVPLAKWRELTTAANPD